MVNQGYLLQWKIITLCVSHGSSLKFMGSPLNINSAKSTSWTY
ncbi:hypothetical protein L342_3210 [Escherichia coli CE516]|nr:hypothetical protein ECDEC10D_2392 [Escherichia coli DEC10D]EIJ13311.1 hypothetical protein EC900105_2202 [Escherichia coli 900105 (10e)]ESS92102.1 hypothetical protein L342_3210 [Escherichia coli CE516]KDW18582.1 putative ankyrin repeat protein B [Escherichia coli 2-177-06_S3_C1]